MQIVPQTIKMEQNEILLAIQKDIAELKKSTRPDGIISSVSEKWIPEKQVKSFFNYESTQMASFLKSEELVVSKIGKRKFILKESIEKLLAKNIQNHLTSKSNG